MRASYSSILFHVCTNIFHWFLFQSPLVARPGWKGRSMKVICVVVPAQAQNCQPCQHRDIEMAWIRMLSGPKTGNFWQVKEHSISFAGAVDPPKYGHNNSKYCLLQWLLWYCSTCAVPARGLAQMLYQHDIIIDE